MVNMGSYENCLLKREYDKEQELKKIAEEKKWLRDLQKTVERMQEEVKNSSRDIEPKQKADPRKAEKCLRF